LLKSYQPAAPAKPGWRARSAAAEAFRRPHYRPRRCRYRRLFRSLCRTQLLILDDWGPEPMTAEQRRDLLEIVEDR
jgi:hypothetical protein